jgi:hypothetical protein
VGDGNHPEVSGKIFNFQFLIFDWRDRAARNMAIQAFSAAGRKLLRSFE